MLNICLMCIYFTLKDAEFNFKGYPTVFIFDKQGKLIYSKTGYDISWYKTEKTILQKILNKALSAN